MKYKVPAIAVMVTGTDQQWRVAPDPMEIFFDDHNLDVKIKIRTKIEQIASDDDQIKTAGVCHQPIELLKRIMQVGDE